MSVLDDTYGCLFLALVFTTALWAVSCLQLWFYIENYFHTDKLCLKSYVVLVWVLDTVHQVLSFKFLYIYFVKEFGNVDFLNHLPKDIFGTAPLLAVVSAMVQIIFLMRIWILGERNYILTGGLAFLVLSQFVITLIYTAKSGNLESYDEFTAMANIESAMNMIIFAADNAIALALVYLLWRRRSSFNRTESILKRLVAFTIGTGLIVGILMVIAFVFAEVRPKSMVYISLDFCLAKNGTGAEGQTHVSVKPTVIVSDLHKGPYPDAIECRVDIRINSDTERATTKYLPDGLASDFQGDKINSAV